MRVAFIVQRCEAEVKWGAESLPPNRATDGTLLEHGNARDLRPGL